jgi:hypothetical protein
MRWPKGSLSPQWALGKVCSQTEARALVEEVVPALIGD